MLLGGSRVVVIGVRNRVTQRITHIRGLAAQVITTQEPIMVLSGLHTGSMQFLNLSGMVLHRFHISSTRFL